MNECVAGVMVRAATDPATEVSIHATPSKSSMRRAIVVATILGCATTAHASNSRFVDVTVTYDRTIRRAPTSEFAGDCPIKNTEKGVMTILGQLTFTHVELVDSPSRLALTLPAHPKTLSGTAKLTFTFESHQTTCRSKSDASGEASSAAAAKAFHLELELDKKTGRGSLTIAADFPTAKATGTLTTTDATGTSKQDWASIIASAAWTLEGSMGAFTLQTKASLGAQPPATMIRLAQDLPFEIERSGDDFDVVYTNDHTTDLATEPPPSTAHDKHGGTLDVTTELHIHIAPAAK